WADKGRHLPGRDAQGDVPECHLPAVGYGEILNFDGGHARRPVDQRGRFRFRDNRARLRLGGRPVGRSRRGLGHHRCEFVFLHSFMPPQKADDWYRWRRRWRSTTADRLRPVMSANSTSVVANTMGLAASTLGDWKPAS